MILSNKESVQDYNCVSQSLNNEIKQYEVLLNNKLRKMVYMQLYNRIRRLELASNMVNIVLVMQSKGLW